SCEIARRRSRDRLHERGLYQERSKVRRDSRQRGEPLAFRKSKTATSKWKIRDDWRRERQSAGLDRIFGKTAEGVNHETVRQPANGNDDGGDEAIRFEIFRRSNAKRKTEAGHRPDVQVKRDPASDRVCGRRTRSRQIGRAHV